jgi:CheY-like chemotaxis protein
MPYNYIYIDDTLNQIEQGTINGIQHGEQIFVKFFKPNAWETQITDLIKLLPDYDGIILDLRLNDKPYAENMYAQYRGSTVAQELRTLTKEGVIARDFPIVLISANDKLDESLDETGIDLFDAVISKNYLGADQGVSYADFRKLLIGLASGYRFLHENEKKPEIVLSIRDFNIIDTRFLNELHNNLTNNNHVIARFLKRNILTKPSFLIDEQLLSARLGVSTDSEDWVTLRDSILLDFRYSGLFSDYFIRWWMPMIEVWWGNKISSEENLRTLPAERRVALLKQKLKLDNLTPLTKSEKSSSSAFWVVCKAQKIPIDTIDGLLISGQDSCFPWQEKEYICIEEALRPSKLNMWKDVATIEKNRLQKLKDFYGKSERRIRN